MPFTILAGFALLSTDLVPAAIAQERSLNRGFEDPDAERSQFERDGRTVYDRRYELMDLRPSGPRRLRRDDRDLTGVPIVDVVRRELKVPSRIVSTV